jgi:hypothetical protein
MHVSKKVSINSKIKFIWKKRISDQQSIGIIEYPTTRVIVFNVDGGCYQIKVYHFNTETRHDLNDIVINKIEDMDKFTKILQEAEDFVEVSLAMSA